MTESTPVSLNLQSPNISTVVYAVQNDRSARHIVAQLRDGSSPWTPPYGAAAVIRYLKPDGTGGFYDTDDNNNSAVTITGSVGDLTLVEQTLTVPGDVYMQLNFYATDGTRLTSFAWILRVQPSVLADAPIVSSDYFNALTAKIAEGAAVAAQLTFPVPIQNGGTDATDAANARTNLDLAGVYAKEFIAIGDVGTSGKTVSISNSTVSYLPFVIVTNGVNSNRQGLYIASLRRTSESVVSAVLSASAITVTVGTNSINVSASGSNSFVYLLPLSDSARDNITIT